MSFSGKELTSKLAADGTLTLELNDNTWEAPKGNYILVKMEATPINPSDLALLISEADVEHAQYLPGKVIANMPEADTKRLSARHGKALPAGTEGAGMVVAAGEEPAAQALLGKRVACVPGTAYATYAYSDARMAMPVDEGMNAEQAASSFVNPMTALGFIETMKAEGFKGLIHAAAASNLGQMLTRICVADGIPLVNIVRSEHQVQLLKGLGATHVINMKDPDFEDQLVAAIAETGAMVGFDPIGGGTMANTMLTCMEKHAAVNMEYNRYGSNEAKKVHVYGMLDTGPTILTRRYGFAWSIDGWLLGQFMMKAGSETVGRMRMRVMKELTTTFASEYSHRISLEEMLTKDALCDYNARRTGQKYLVLPN